MRAAIILGAGILLSVTFAPEAQSSRQRQRQPSPPVVIIERDRVPPPPIRERRTSPPRTFWDISPPMQGPTPLAPMAPRVGN
jgi:hypothetical protein